MQKMIKRLFALLCAFIISISFMCQSSLTVYASSILTEEDKDALEDGLEFAVDIIEEFWMTIPKIENAMRLMFGQIGLFLNQDKWSEGRLYDMYCEYLTEKAIIENSENYDDYLKAHIKVNANENEITSVEADSEIMNTFYDFSVDVIENECGWYEIQTADVSDVSATWFSTQEDYNKFVGFLKNLGPNDGIVVKGFAGYYADSSNTNWVTGALCSDIFDVTEFDLVLDYYYEPSTSYPYGGISFRFYKDWLDDSTVMSNLRLINSATELIDNPTSDTSWADGWYSVTMDACTFPSVDVRNSQTAEQFIGGNNPWRRVLFTKTSRLLRVYKTVDDMKMYSVGERPYYATSDFYNYDSSQDNSVTLTGSDLSNGSVYGDVYNYIINNYDNPDGLTENELRDILDDYFNNSGGGSGSSGNNSGSGSSGNGLMDFLGGLGSIGDAILSILGKLMEYIGKALDLIGGTVTKVIDIIPKNITALLGALFPFFPEEWLTAIELGLVLAVIVGIVGLFKK